MASFKELLLLCIDGELCLSSLQGQTQHMHTHYTHNTYTQSSRDSQLAERQTPRKYNLKVETICLKMALITDPKIVNTFVK